MNRTRPPISAVFPSPGWVGLVAATLMLTGCAGREMVLEVYGSVMYEKPVIREISHNLRDHRPEGGAPVIEVTLAGDPGLIASFDISPGVVDQNPMREIEAGVYSGEFSFPADFLGGPFTIIGRLNHPDAGEVILRDPDPLTISLLPRRP